MEKRIYNCSLSYLWRHMGNTSLCKVTGNCVRTIVLRKSRAQFFFNPLCKQYLTCIPLESIILYIKTIFRLSQILYY